MRPRPRDGRMKTLAKVILGCGFGAILLWFALSGTDLEQARAAIGRGNPTVMLFAVVAYWVALTVRVARWRMLLSTVTPLAFGQVWRVLIVGYAVNNLLPARLGELFRADYLRRRCAVSRSVGLGSIIMERLLDGICVLAMLGGGLLATGSLRDNPALLGAAVAGFAVVVAGFATVYALIIWHVRLPLERFPWLQKRLGAFVQGLTTLRAGVFLKALALSGAIWCLEAFAIYLIMRGFGIEAGIAGAALTVGAAALSTLLPSAPGYLGSLQVAFVLAYSALGLAPILGVLSATALQLLLLGSVTLVGLAMLALGTFYRAAIPVRPLGGDDEPRLGASTQ